MTTSTEKTTDLLAAVLADLAPVVGGITGEQLHDRTPCTEYDVEQLRDHVLGWLTTFAAGFADPDGQAPRASLDGYKEPADAAAEVRTAAGGPARAVRGGAGGFASLRSYRLSEYGSPRAQRLCHHLCGGDEGTLIGFVKAWAQTPVLGLPGPLPIVDGIPGADQVRLLEVPPAVFFAVRDGVT